MTADDEELRRAVDERLAARIADANWREDGRRRRLAELSERRQYGLMARHRNKLTRTEQNETFFREVTELRTLRTTVPADMYAAIERFAAATGVDTATATWFLVLLGAVVADALPEVSDETDHHA